MSPPLKKETCQMSPVIVMNRVTSLNKRKLLHLLSLVDIYSLCLDCARYNEDFVVLRFVISRFCSIHFIVTLAGLKNIVRYTEDFVKSRFHCKINKAALLKM